MPAAGAWRLQETQGPLVVCKVRIANLRLGRLHVFCDKLSRFGIESSLARQALTRF
jgi:hypothetical protein